MVQAGDEDEGIDPVPLGEILEVVPFEYVPVPLIGMLLGEPVPTDAPLLYTAVPLEDGVDVAHPAPK